MTGEDSFKTGGGLEGFQEAVSGGEDPLVGEVFGSYRVEGLIAEGGMGRVYRGVRDDGQFDRSVAIKILPPGLGNEYIRRFEQERQILASLSHPNIAQLFDAGLSATGSLYLVMELVDGVPIDAHVQARHASTRTKVKLVLALSETLAFAHSKLVVHRDLKPSNVFVTHDGELKLLDFGIAKILETSDNVTIDSRPMTPSYASPEQLLNEPVSVASDVYQLGLLFLTLFEQRDDVTPETRASATERAIRKASVTVESRLAERLPAELGAIINKCLRIEPAERYASATDLATDLRNFLGGFPVSARNPGPLQHAAKFVRRNWLPTAAVSLAFVSLSVMLIVTVHQQRATQEALEFAKHQQARAESTTGFLVDLFNANRPQEALGEDLTARDILQRGLDKLAELDDQPELKADLLDTVAGVYRQLGDHEMSLQLATESLEIKEAIYDDEPLEIAATLGLIARLQLWFGDFEDALATGRRVHTIYVDELGRDDERTLDALNLIGTAHQRMDQYAEAVQALVAVLEGKRRIHGKNHPSVTTAINNLAVAYGDQGDYAKAVELMEQVVRWNEVQLPADHPWAAMDWHNYGGFLGNLGRYEDAGDALRESLRIRQKVQGEDHPLVGYTLQALGVLARQSGDLDGALDLFQRALDVLSRSVVAPHTYLAATLVSLGSLEQLLGQTAVAEDRIVDAAGQYRELLGESSYAHTADLALARLRLDQRRPQQALELIEPVIASGSTIPQLYAALPLKARALRQLGRLGESETVIDEAIAFLQPRVGPHHLALIDARLEKGRLLLDRQRSDEAVTFLQDVLESCERDLPPGHWYTDVARALYAEARIAAGGDPEARKDLESAIRQLETRLPASDPSIVRGRGVQGPG